MPLREIKKYPLSFALLLLAFIVFIILFFVFATDPHFQRRLVYFAGGFYFIWSLLYHYQKGDLNLSLVIEYLVVALLGAILLTGTLLY